MQGFTQTVVVSALVTIDGIVQRNGSLLAYVGAELRGSQATPTSPPFGPYVSQPIFQIGVYFGVETAELISFFFHDGVSARRLSGQVGYDQSAVADVGSRSCWDFSFGVPLHRGALGSSQAGVALPAVPEL